MLNDKNNDFNENNDVNSGNDIPKYNTTPEYSGSYYSKQYDNYNDIDPLKKSIYEKSYMITSDTSNQQNVSSSKNTNLTKGTAAVIVVICMIASLIFGFTGGVIASKISSKGGSSGGLGIQIAEPKDENSQAPVYTGEEMSTEAVAGYAADSVVEISTESVQRGSMMQQYVVQGAGSGVIVTEDGYIITNNHVISGASKITVRLKDTTSYEAKLIGTDSELDVALLKIEATGLKAVIMGDSSSLKVGEKAIAIGNPLGELGGTVTEGIISSLDRTIALNNTNMTLLQTDAAINPGNSGGGLFNSRGEFIGLVVAKSSGEDVEGLGFAIPVNNVKPVVNDLSTYGYVKGRPQLGVSLVDINSTQVAKKYGLSQMGVYVASVSAGSSAANAGIAEGDMIISIDGTTVGTSAEVQQIIRSHTVGDTLSIQISRKGQIQTVSAVLAESSPSTNQSQQQDTQPSSQSQDYYNPFSEFGFDFGN